MTNTDKISVIVPVYKAEAYLDRCVGSIAGQTYQNLEIILIDDGSPDNCPALCDAWAEKDSRVRVIHQKNAGGAQARNAGLDIAQGELIAFVDSDDYIAPDMYKYLSGLLEKGYDIAECDYLEVWDSGAVFAQPQEALAAYSPQEAMGAHIQDTFFRQLIWNKLYRRSVVEHVRFPRGKSIDDEFFTYQLLGNAKKLVRSNQIFYAYRQQQGSVMHSMPIQKRLQALEAKQLRHQYILQHFPALEADSLRDLWFTALYQGQLALRQLPREESERALALIRPVLRAYPAAGVLGSMTPKEKLWIRFASFSLSSCCKVRNRLKIGL